MTGAEYGILGICLFALAAWNVRRELYFSKVISTVQSEKTALYERQLADYKAVVERNNALHERTVMALEAVADVLEGVASRLEASDEK